MFFFFSGEGGKTALFCCVAGSGSMEFQVQCPDHSVRNGEALAESRGAVVRGTVEAQT